MSNDEEDYTLGLVDALLSDKAERSARFLDALNPDAKLNRRDRESARQVETAREHQP